MNNIKKREFESQTLKVLDLVVNSLYSNKDVFLREIISNSADAIDKARFLSLTNKSITANEWEIVINIDKEKHIIKIEDNGIGMNEQEVINNIGTIACSGTRVFLDSINENKKENNVNLVGQFGVGFYSAFMVSDKIILETKKAGVDDVAIEWFSDGKSEYSITKSNKLEQGTIVTLHLKKECSEYLDEWKVKDIIKNYSDFIEYPIILKKNVNVDDKKKENNDTYETVNSGKAIWLKFPNDIKDEEYDNFFNYISHTTDKAIKRIHYSVEGTVTFTSLIYIPSKNIYGGILANTNRSLSLYVNKIFITSNCIELLPRYLRFIYGVVDSSDLSLNISRETLQDNEVIKKIKTNITKKILVALQNIKNEFPEDYILFFKEFGIFLKEGMYSDYENRDILVNLLLFESIKNINNTNLSLKDYFDNMQEGQKDIYYITGEDRNILINSPHLEIFKKNDYDVLLMTDPIDEFIILQLNEYNDKKFRSVEKGNFGFDNENISTINTTDSNEDNEKDYNTFFEFIKNILKDDIKLVRFSSRLLNSPCCIVNEMNDHSSNMEKIMKLMNHKIPKSMKILELNKNHKIVISIRKLFDSDSNRIDLNNYIKLLYDCALMRNGEHPKDLTEFVENITDIAILNLENKII